MNKILLTTTFVFMLISNCLFAQQNKGEIKFETEQHNFGVVKEDGGTHNYSFVFSNTGEEPIVITNVRSNCGCATPDWTKQPVMPGGKGFVKVEFNPRNMPGKFNKTIVVSSTALSANKVLRILGEVTPRKRTIEDDFPYVIGSIRFRTNHLSFGNMAPGTVKTDSLSFINLTNETLTIDFPRVPPHLEIKVSPSNVKPGQKGKVEITYNTGEKDDWGIVSDYFQMNISDNPQQTHYLYASVNIQEDFSKWDVAQLENAPVIEFGEKVWNIGQISQGEKFEHEYVFTNKGKSDLIIRKVRAGCGCTAIAPTKTVLKPGESGTVKAVFDSRGQRGRQNKGITVVSNDPVSPTVILRITGEVLTD
jgi:hypothetical protein